MPRVLVLRSRHGDYIELDRISFKTTDGGDFSLLLDECDFAQVIEVSAKPVPIVSSNGDGPHRIMGAGDIDSGEEIGGLG